VVNILTGKISELSPWVGSHMEIDGIDASWTNNLQVDGDSVEVAAMNLQEIVTTWIAPEPEPVDLTKLSEEDLESIAEDVKFLDELPKSYKDLPKEDLKNVLATN